MFSVQFSNFTLKKLWNTSSRVTKWGKYLELKKKVTTSFFHAFYFVLWLPLRIPSRSTFLKWMKIQCLVVHIPRRSSSRIALVVDAAPSWTISPSIFASFSTQHQQQAPPFPSSVLNSPSRGPLNGSSRIRGQTKRSLLSYQTETILNASSLYYTNTSKTKFSPSLSLSYTLFSYYYQTLFTSVDVQTNDTGDSPQTPRPTPLKEVAIILRVLELRSVQKFAYHRETRILHIVYIVPMG